MNVNANVKKSATSTETIPFTAKKNTKHKGCPHNMITNRFSQALASLLTLTTANIISPKAILTNKHSYTSHLTLLHVPLTYPINQTLNAILQLFFQ
jgi:hypothetical protein